MADRALSGEPRIQRHPRGRHCNPRDPGQQRAACQDPAQPGRRAAPRTTPTSTATCHAGGHAPIDPDLKPQSVRRDRAGRRIRGAAREPRSALSYTRRRLNNVIEDMSRDEANTYFIGNPGHGIAADFPEARARLRRRDRLLHPSSFQDSWLAQASYTLSWLRGNYSRPLPPGDRPARSQHQRGLRPAERCCPTATARCPATAATSSSCSARGRWTIGQRHRMRAGGSACGPTRVSRPAISGPTRRYGNGSIYILERGSGRAPLAIRGRIPGSATP